MLYRGYTDGPYGQIHFQDTRNGAPLVLCHQAPMSSRQFDSVYGLLADRGIRAIGIDMPGFGASDPTDFVPRIEDYARAIPPVLDHLGIESTFVLGHHTGAMVATEAALQFGDRVIGVILNGPLPLTADERAAGLQYVEAEEKGYQAQPDGSHFLKLFGNRMAYATEKTDWNLATQYIVEQLSGPGPFWYGHHAAFQYDHGKTIPLITHPTLVLTNTGDAIYKNALDAMALRPDFSFAEIKGGTIDIVDEEPEAWADAVAAFIRETTTAKTA
ncbi:MAG: alpha/beta hydrolase [Rhodospirillaceae bacterium]|jgi:pimeloyl-ACP methyl ester carboxylesterase|nr:alpha/beta hydrolase [Rhodospirillaceae bacterium]MBT5566978.1 alpha/beta hydrolase [Rhodospirillaceae bacterium]MBT6090335.1 alpha/beta hydrolase [Rhodospirillaceae bacterium]MBT7449826.1 alpha/beta hydrolase [Rhodospirillaceae bacterium]